MNASMGPANGGQANAKASQPQRVSPSSRKKKNNQGRQSQSLVPIRQAESVPEKRSPERKAVANKYRDILTNGAKTLILGSSIVSGVLKNDPNTQVYSFPGITTHKLTSLVRKAKQQPSTTPPRIVVLHVGGNNLSNGQDHDHALGDHWELLDATKDQFPNSKIVVSGVLYRKGLAYRTVKDYNKSLQWLCDCQQVAFANGTTAIRNQHYRGDRIHLNELGARELGTMLLQFFRLTA